MSETFLRPKVSSTKVTDWVDPAFDDFSASTAITTITASSLSLNNSSHRRKHLSSTLESNRLPARKRGRLSLEQTYGLETSREHVSDNEPWVDKYKPETQHELAVHKKKIEEVETWLKAQVLEVKPKQGGSILLITGPPGCGKTTTIKILSKELGIQVQEWVNPILPDFQKDDYKELLNLESNLSVVPYQSQIAVFKDFLLRATKYSKLQMLGEDLTTDKKIILVEDLPNQFYRDANSLHEILRKYVQIGRCPLVFIVSDSVSGDNNQRLLFPKNIQEECSVSNISFNPVAPTIMMKFLNRIVTIEASKNGEKITVPNKTCVELLCQGCSGDIRSAINSLQFSSSKGENNSWSKKKRMSLKSDAAISKSKQKKKHNSTLENQEIQAIGGKDVSLFLFRALGKILYCKRAPLAELDSPRLPAHLSEHDRDTLLVQPEEIVEMSHMPGDFFNLYLHQNYIDFFTEVDDLVQASEFLSFADILGGDWNTRLLLREYSTSVATRGVMHSNKSRGFAHCQGGGSSFRPLHKPQWFVIHKKYRENCLAAKALFFDFCLPALCLQTQLLPYLALLTIPMRNKAQISFIQDIGRLPLKRNFGRLKMEALTDRELGLIDPDSGDEFLHSGGQPAQTADPETWSLPLSQNSGSDLPASQPQPFSSKVDMEDEEEEEEDIIIEDYDSDET
ncbi:cell cycle checkpoint protein RAD17 [Mastomys coucha]|uniref:cell cycle checkpoint protein RAD17 n=1 Tax=Mastomys coucha TaxID=35658 RepID=UPI001262049E|nr:cell cycle checkpoint protein RAD17 [Mastomys coucha]XP_031216330.1 cell cycle checkpoint protein RAD17 [Mastomys coucha]XP_031216331.1 cell cycle checkpoint protein RAD17 [Mastomys coucha]XP_031216332.1 cell cycle checkpoint protein RAD17 [Mastomys coucha]